MAVRGISAGRVHAVRNMGGRPIQGKVDTQLAQELTVVASGSPTHPQAFDLWVF